LSRASAAAGRASPPPPAQVAASAQRAGVAHRWSWSARVRRQARSALLRRESRMAAGRSSRSGASGRIGGRIRWSSSPLAPSDHVRLSFEGTERDPFPPVIFVVRGVGSPAPLSSLRACARGQVVRGRQPPQGVSVRSVALTRRLQQAGEDEENDLRGEQGLNDPQSRELEIEARLERSARRQQAEAARRRLLRLSVVEPALYRDPPR
jgi:hypothetical protein